MRDREYNFFFFLKSRFETIDFRILGKLACIDTIKAAKSSFRFGIKTQKTQKQDLSRFTGFRLSPLPKTVVSQTLILT